MRERLLEWLVCPLCHGNLELKSAKSRHVAPHHRAGALGGAGNGQTSDEPVEDVIAGALTCSDCRVYYPIYDGVPRMLTYATKVAEMHASENASWNKDNLEDLMLPQEVAPLGEEAVLRNFSREWQGYEWTGDNYWASTTDNMLQSMRHVLGVAKHPLKNKVVLEVGIGIGGIADALSRSEGCEIVGIDLGYSVDRARHYFGDNMNLHIVQASMFAPPFRSGTFDVVYSQGVLHHSYSTRAAFESIARLPKRQGGMLYVWVYSHANERATFLRRALMAVETVSRPLVSRLPGKAQTIALLPALPFYIAYQNLVRRRKFGPQMAAWYGWNEALHAARDRLTPPYAHRHSYEEVASWFKSQGYGHLECLKDEALPDHVFASFARNVAIRGFRT